MLAQPPSLPVVLQPALEAWPLTQQRFVRDLDAALGDGDEPVSSEGLEHARDVVVPGDIEISQRDSPAYDDLALTGNKPEHDTPGNLLLCRSERCKGLLRQPSNRTAYPTGLLVRLEPQRAAFASLPELYEGGREQRETAGLVTHVGDERIDQLGIDPEAGPGRRELDRPTILIRSHRPDQHAVGPEQLRKRRVLRAMAEEIGAQRNDDGRLAVPSRGQPRAATRRRRPAPPRRRG